MLLNLAAEYIRENWPDGEIDYDGTTCDGYCLADDCESEAKMLVIPEEANAIAN
jgi:hypothetical protein